MKYDLAKLFGDVDDKFIEGAKPEAQKPIMVKAVRRSPMRMIAAASCAAVVLAGGVITANMIQSRGNLPAFESKDSAYISNDGSGSGMRNESNNNWYNEEQIYYEGEYYKVAEDTLSFYRMDKKLVGLAGIRRSSENVVDIVTMIKNNYTEPAAIRCYGSDSVVEIKFVPKSENPDEEQTPPDYMTEKPLSVVLQPGEVCYQKSSFNVGYGEYMGEVKFAFQNADSNLLQAFSGAPVFRFRETIGEDGFTDLYRGDSESSDKSDESEKDNSGKISEICDFTNRPALYAIRQLEKEGFKTVTVSKVDNNVARDCVIGTNPPAHSMAEQGSTVVVIVSMDKKNDLLN